MLNTRPSKDQYFAAMAMLVSARATCPRRRVGCVLINERGHVLSTGYNGVAAGSVHCTEHNCPGACYPSGQGLDKCEALHAEQNALLQCRDVWTIDTAYVTASPCVTCTKLFMNTSCKRIVFIDEYPQPEAKTLWTSSFVPDSPIVANRRWDKYEGKIQLINWG